MKSLLFAVALTAASDAHSLGIGLDVLPEAFGSAAGRVHVSAALRDPRCTASACVWNVGANVVVEARLLAGTLSLVSLEARGSRGTATFLAACRTIAILVRPNDAPGARQAAVLAMMTGGEDSLDAAVTLYGRIRAGADDAVCGAAAAE